MGRRGPDRVLRGAARAPRGTIVAGRLPVGAVQPDSTAPDVPGSACPKRRAVVVHAWIKCYRRNENSANSAISYYTKGGVIGFLLDARIRRITDGARSLDDVMRLAYERYSGERGFTPEEFWSTVEEIAGTDLDAWFEAALETVDELDYTEATDWFGLEFSSSETDVAPDDQPTPAWLGLAAENTEGRLVVMRVPRETPAYAAGFNVGDEILAIDGYRVRANDWAQRLPSYRADEDAVVLVARRDRLVELKVTFGAPPDATWHLSIPPEPPDTTQSRLDRWLGV